MTLYHFGNCIALTYAPYHMAYKLSGMPEYGAWWRCVQSGAMYLVTALAKMLFLATFFPDGDVALRTHEFLKASVDYADLLGLYLALNSVPGKGHAKIFTAAIGWAAAQAVCSHGIELWVGARGAEFSWRWLQISLSCSLSLCEWCVLAAMLWLSMRGRQHKLLTFTAPVLLLAPYATLLGGLVAPSAWIALAIRAAYALLTALTATGLYAHLTQLIGY